MLCAVINSDEQKTSTTPITQRFTFEIESVDTTALLIDFLAEALSLMQTYFVLLPRVSIILLEETRVVGEFSGFNIDSFSEDVKAVTYHEADVTFNKNNEYETIIILDI